MKRFLLLIFIVIIILTIVSCDENSSGITNAECSHKYTKWSVIQEATCISEGTQTRVCEICGFTESQSIAKIAHNEVVDQAVDATCTENGLSQGKHCSVCHMVIEAQVQISPVGHTIIIDEAKEATCSDNGLTEGSHCSVCNTIITDQKTIPALSHIEIIDKAIPATCTENGLTEGKHCSLCNKVIIAQRTVSASHQYDNGTIIVNATCSAYGEKIYTCAVCKNTKKATIGMLSHKFDSGKITTSAKCESDGIKTYTCTICGNKKTETITKLGHDPNSNYICTRCGKTCPVELNMTSSEKNNAIKVHYISQRQIWHQDDNNRYVLVFSLLDSSKNELSVPAVVEIIIKNDNGEIVYSAIKTIKSSDYSTWYYNNGATPKYQATIYINDEDIKNGTIEDGDVYFTVYNTGYFNFDESQLSIYDLPLKPTTILLPTLPYTVSDYTYSGKVDSSVKITNITYEISGDNLYLYFTGEKTYDAEGAKYSQSCKVGWKLYDSEGFIVDSGTFYSPDIAVGEKFRNEKEYSFDVIKPGETYKLVISSVE